MVNGILADNRIRTVIAYMRETLSSSFDSRETNQVVRGLCHELLSMSPAEIILNGELTLGESELLRVHQAVQRIEKGEPVQYVTGRTWFRGKPFEVNPAVLIPRPETEELVELAIHRAGERSLRLLDVGTGSGCIAISLALSLPQSTLVGCDVSEAALDVARQNALLLSADVEFVQCDILHDWPEQNWDMIISNPPYIPLSETQTMAERVTGYEPGIALFVSDDDPLIFYRRIAEYLSRNRKATAMCEIHPQFALSLTAMGKEYSLESEILRDAQDRDRFLIWKSRFES